jgi:predicted membrane metal-binding protein
LTGEAGNASRRKVIVEATARSLEWASAWRTQDESGPTFSRVIRTNFGDRMAKIFRENSDSLVNGYRYLYKKSNKLTDFKKGDIWQFSLRLKRPRAFWNPGSFDYQAELFQQNICATGYLVEKFPFRLIQPAGIYYFIDHLRQKINENVKKALKTYPLLGLVSALTTGIRCEITDEQWRVMRGSGTNHLFAISGLHLAFIAGIIYWIVRFVCCRIPYAALYIPAPRPVSRYSHEKFWPSCPQN